MQLPEKERNNNPEPARAQNEFLFTLFMVFVAMAVVLGLFVPRSVSAQPLDRLRWEASPSVVADVVIRNALDGRAVDVRCLNACVETLETRAKKNQPSMMLTAFVSSDIDIQPHQHSAD